jgi:hypothetical protein
VSIFAPLDLNTADRLARGELERIQLNRSYTYRLGRREWPIYTAAKQQGYVVMPRTENAYSRLEYVWQRWCEPRNWPMVCIKPRLKYALIDADLIDLPEGRRPSRDQLAPIERLFEEHAGGTWWSVDPTFIAAGRVPLAVAPLIASRIVTILWSAAGLAPLPAEVN